MKKSHIFDEKTFEHHKSSQERLIATIENAKNAYDQSMSEYVFGGSTIIITIYGLSLTWLQILQNNMKQSCCLDVFLGFLVLLTVIFIGCEVGLRFWISKKITKTKYVAYAYMQQIQQKFLDKFKNSIQDNFKTKFTIKTDTEDESKIQEFYDSNLKTHTEIEKEQNEYIDRGIKGIMEGFIKSQEEYESYRLILNWIFGGVLLYNIILIIIIYFF